MLKPYVIIGTAIALMAAACSGGGSGSTSDTSKQTATETAPSPKGIGEVKNVSLNNPLDATMVERGQGIYEMKCAACHKLTDQRVVGPGWNGITERRPPEWIMNMTTNVEVMLAEDPVAQELLKECLVRMPNQNLSIGDARDVLEFMYKNDGHEVGTE
jgi:cytochrome c